jgi:hypothetical protein
LVINLEETEARNDCADQDQQQFNLPIDQTSCSESAAMLQSCHYVLVVSRLPSGEGVSTEAEELALLGAVTWQCLVKT